MAQYQVIKSRIETQRHIRVSKDGEGMFWSGFAASSEAAWLSSKRGIWGLMHIAPAKACEVPFPQALRHSAT